MIDRFHVNLADLRYQGHPHYEMTANYWERKPYGGIVLYARSLARAATPHG
jgi:hypothetical protein